MSTSNKMLGTTRTFFHVGGPDGPKISVGRGDPNNAVSGSPGDLYFDQNGILWVKEVGVGDGTGWVAK